MPFTAALAVLTAAASASPQVPYPAALGAAAIEVDALASLLDQSLLIGNGDINGLVWTDDGALSVTLTKNDVWDARLDTTNDPPLPTLQRILELGASGGPIGDPVLPAGTVWSGPDSYHASPYPCPVTCGHLRLGANRPAPRWSAIREEGTTNAWAREAGDAVMSIDGRPGASNGYAYAPLTVSTDRCPRLAVTLAGSENARFFIDVIGAKGESLLHTGWLDAPSAREERVFDLAPRGTAERVILYTWTEDGARAENRFRSVAFEGAAGGESVDLGAAAFAPAATSPARLDLRTAEVTVSGAPTSVPAARVRAQADRNVFVVESEAPARLEAASAPWLPPARTGGFAGARYLLQEIPGDADWPGMRFAVALAEEGPRKAVAIVTSLESENVVRDAASLARSTLRASDDALAASHRAVWDEYWSASGARIEDTALQDAWYRSLYFLRCVTKPGVVSPGLFASLTSDTPAWHGDYHTNYNIQQTFWSAYNCNQAELAEPYDRLVRDYLPRARWLAREIYGLEGAFYPHVMYPYEPSDPEACLSPIGRQYIHHTWGMTLGVSGFTVQPLWWHYKYAPDRTLLEETVYPPLREVARFYAGFVERCEPTQDGTVRLGPTVSPEHWGWTPSLERNYDCAFDIAMVRYTLSAAIEASEALGVDSELRERFRAALALLPDYPLSDSDPPVVVDVAGAPPIEYNIAVPATPVFPGDAVTALSPESERALFERSIEALAWNGNNSTFMLAVARARLGMPGSAGWLRREIEARLRPNGTLTLNRLEPHQPFNDFGHYTEQFAAAMAVSELMIQSVGDVVRVRPLGEDSPRMAFTRLRTQGGFLVSSESDGTFVVESTVGGPLRLAVPTGGLEFLRSEARDWTLAAADESGITHLDTRVGELVRFRSVHTH